MDSLNILVVGGGIGGLTAAIAMGQRGYRVDVIEKDPEWSVYGVGIIQQANVIRAVAELGIIDDYVGAGYGYNKVEVYIPTGEKVATIPAPALVEGYPAQLGIGRRALQKVLADRARTVGAEIHLGVVVESFADDGQGVDVTFSDGRSGRYDVLVGADGLYSQMREELFPEADAPRFAGQGVWRYNFEKPADLDALSAYEGPIGMGLVPLSESLMYMFLTTPEPGNPRYPEEGIAAAMREKLSAAPPAMAELAEQITEDSEVVYRPLFWHFISGDWFRGRCVLIGDAAHGTTPHLGQGAGMAIEDCVVLADELANADSVEAAFAGFQKRRFERCRYIVESSVALCNGQIGQGPRVNQAEATADMFRVVSQPL